MDVNSCSRVTVQCHCLSEANTSIFRNRSLSSFQATSSDLNWKVEQVSCTIFYSATASTSLLSSSPSAFFFLKLICFASTLWRLSCFRSRKCIPQGTPFPLTSKLHLYPVGQTASFVPFPWSGVRAPLCHFWKKGLKKYLQAYTWAWKVQSQLKCTQLTQLRAEAGTSNSFETDMKYM